MWLLFSAAAGAAVLPITDLPLVAAIPQHWRLPAGILRGSFSIDQPLQLTCEPGAVIHSQGLGNGLLINAADVTVEGCTFLDWGHDLTAMNAAIFIQPKAHGTLIKNNRLRGQGFGVWVDGTADVVLIDNQIQGDPTMRSQDQGQWHPHLYAVKGARVIGNQVRDARDGIYIDTSNGNLLQGNTLEDLRYGIHYMFANDNQVLGNITRRTRTGYALMQSRKLTVIGNRSEEDQNYGILMNSTSPYSTPTAWRRLACASNTTGDMVTETKAGALFIHNSLFNSIEHNHFGRSAVGIHLTAGSEDNRIANNAFVGNQRQVKYVATRLQEWSADSRGNYWSDYLGWDRNAPTASAMWPTSPTITSTACCGCIPRCAC